VVTLLNQHNPGIVLVQDFRDWDRNNPGGSFGNRQLHFDRIECLSGEHDIFKIGLVKDAGSMIEYQCMAISTIGADAVVVYYHPKSVLAQSGWLKGMQLIRTYHSIDADYCASI